MRFWSIILDALESQHLTAFNSGRERLEYIVIVKLHTIYIYAMKINKSMSGSGALVPIRISFRSHWIS